MIVKELQYAKATLEYLGALVVGEGLLACVEQGIIIMLKFIEISY